MLTYLSKCSLKDIIPVLIVTLLLLSVIGTVTATKASAQPPLPEIILEKTVAVDNGNDECGTATALTVPTGTNVRYCFKVTNTGNVLLDSHTLVDNHLGTLLSDFAFQLSPGGSVYLTVVAHIGETVTNTATWTAENLQLTIYDITSSDSVTVKVEDPDFFVIPQKEGKNVIIVL